MKSKILSRQNIINASIISSIIIFGLIAYNGITKTFFQQDEWQYFGNNIYALQSQNPIVTIMLPLGGKLTHFFPLATLLFLLEYILFKTKFYPYVLYDLAFHIINAILIYIFVKKLINNKLIAYLSSILFLVNSISHQAVTWVAAGIGTLPGTSLMLTSLIFFIYFIEKPRLKFLIFSVSALTVSLLFKEISFFLIPLYCIWLTYLLYRGKLNTLKIKTFLLTILGVSITYGFIRLFFLLFNVRSSQPEVGNLNAVSLQVYLIRLFSVPLKGIAQSLIPQNILITLSDHLVKTAYPQFLLADNTVNPFISQSIVFDLVCFTISILFIAFIYSIYKKMFRKADNNKISVLPFMGLMLFLSFIPFIFIPGNAGYFSIFEPRDLYVGEIAATTLIITSIYYFFKKLVKIKPEMFTVLIFSFLLIFHLSNIRKDIQNLENIGSARAFLLEELKNKFPNFPQRVIIYTQSNRTYYGMLPTDKILPVQSGFGRMILVWYQDSEHFPSCMYENLYLHNLLDQGYKECGGRGFGYFRDYDKLVATIKENKIPAKNVISYSWNGQTMEFKDISGDIQRSLSSYGNQK